MHIALTSAGFPPDHDGIGDYTACLAGELAKQVRVTVATTRGARDQIAGVELKECFCVEEISSIGGIAGALSETRPDWVILQYNPFSFGRWGWNPFLVSVFRKRSRRQFAKRFALMIHEPFVPCSRWQFVVMTTWQRWQLWMLGRHADVVFCSIEPWARKFSRWFRQKAVVHLPVGSNVPCLGLSRNEARSQLSISPERVVVGVFGTAHSSRMLNRISYAADAIAQDGGSLEVLYVGPDGRNVSNSLDRIPLRDEGRLSGEDVSRRLAAMDIYLAPFIDGVSTRRGSLMAALQHGLASVGTLGELTDDMLREENGRAMLLAPVDNQDEFARSALALAKDSHLRNELAVNGRVLYERNFAWPCVASKLLSTLRSVHV